MIEVSRSASGVLSRQADAEIRAITDFWSQLSVCEELGATTWGALEPLERQVTEAMRQIPPDLNRMRTATAKAYCLISNTNEF